MIIIQTVGKDQLHSGPKLIWGGSRPKVNRKWPKISSKLGSVSTGLSEVIMRFQFDFGPLYRNSKALFSR